MFDQLDIDSNGNISYEEFTNMLPDGDHVFDYLDINRDRVITKAEVVTAINTETTDQEASHYE